MTCFGIDLFHPLHWAFCRTLNLGRCVLELQNILFDYSSDNLIFSGISFWSSYYFDDDCIKCPNFPVLFLFFNFMGNFPNFIFQPFYYISIIFLISKNPFSFFFEYSFVIASCSFFMEAIFTLFS